MFSIFFAGRLASKMCIINTLLTLLGATEKKNDENKILLEHRLNSMFRVGEKRTLLALCSILFALHSRNASHFTSETLFASLEKRFSLDLSNAIPVYFSTQTRKSSPASAG